MFLVSLRLLLVQLLHLSSYGQQSLVFQILLLAHVGFESIVGRILIIKNKLLLIQLCDQLLTILTGNQSK